MLYIGDNEGVGCVVVGFIKLVVPDSRQCQTYNIWVGRRPHLKIPEHHLMGHCR